MASKPNPRWSDLEPEENAFMKGVGIPAGGTPSCPPPELLQVFHVGGVRGRVEARVKRHVERCRLCQDLIRDLASINAPLTAEEDSRIHDRVFTEPVQERRLRRRWLFWPMIPVLAAAAAIVIAVRIHRGHARQTGGVVSRAEPAPLASLPIFALEKPSIVLPLPMLMRGATGGRTAYDTALARALKPYQQDDYRTAETQLQALAAKYPKSAHALFYSGVSALLGGRNDAAVKDLSRTGALAHGSFANECQWYLALAEVRSGKLGQAAATLRGLCSTPGEYQSRACTGFADLSAPSKAAQPR